MVARKLNSDDMHDRVTDLFARAAGERSFRQWPRVRRPQCARLARPDCVKTLFIEPGSPWENGYCEGFNSKLRDELLARELFSTFYEAKVLIERSRRHYNTTIRLHSSLDHRPPAPETVLLSASPLACASPRPAEGLATRGRVNAWHRIERQAMIGSPRGGRWVDVLTGKRAHRSCGDQRKKGA